MSIETNITKMFSIKYPIISAPMGPFFTRELAVAVSEAGGLGVLSHTTLQDRDSVDDMMADMEYVVEHTDKPFGFNIRTSRVQPDVRSLVRKIPRFILEHPKIKEQCVYALTSAGSAKTLPNSKYFQKLRDESQIKHFHVVPALWYMSKCLDAGVDGVVVTGTEGGGHQSYEKISTLVLLQQMQQKHPDLPMIACGGFVTGKGLAAALSLGAGAVAMGTRFIAAKESEFHENYKKVIPPARATDTELVTGLFGPIRLWKNSYTEKHKELVASREEKMATENLDLDAIWEEQKAYEMLYHGNIDDGAVPVGQSVGLVDSIENTVDIIEEIMKEAIVALKKAVSLIK